MKTPTKANTIDGVKRLVIPFVIFSFIVYLLTSPGTTPYDYFTRLSDAFLHGRYWLIQNPPWLNELIPAGINRYYVVYPPMPAILSIPFVYLFGQKFQQQYLAHILGAGIVGLTMLLAWRIEKNRLLMLWSGLLVGFGTIVWYLSSNGSVWYLGQITAAFFLTAALVESLGKKRAFLVGIFLGASYLSRLETIVSLPVFTYLSCINVKIHEHKIKKLVFLGLGAIPFIILNAMYNFARFGVIWDKSYLLIPGVLGEPWYKNGIFSLSYIPNHLKIIFSALPKIIKEPPYITPSWSGLAIWITTPAIVYAFFANIKERAVQLSWLSILLISLVVFSHGTTGFTQFGYRFAVDFYPILIFLIIKGVARTGLRWHHWLLLSLGVLVNLWGVLWINKFGWISF